MTRVFFITGCSTGFGASLVQMILDKGDIAVATARQPTSLAFTATTPSNYLALALDVTSPVSITAAFAAALARFHRIDVVVNNAG
jgi:NAD(P)-dependent dehydrogenase (short-subunit alcohol dehydrogenase family)